MKNIIFIYLFIFTLSVTYSQNILIKKAELIIEAGTITNNEVVKIISKDLDVNYINNRPEIISKGKLILSSLKTDDIYLQELITDYSQTEIEFNMVFKNEQFSEKSNLEFTFKSIIQIKINNISEEIPVQVMVSNSKTNQRNLYFIIVSGALLLSNFEIEHISLKDEINFSYRQNVEVNN